MPFRLSPLRLAGAVVVLVGVWLAFGAGVAVALSVGSPREDAERLMVLA